MRRGWRRGSRVLPAGAVVLALAVPASAAAATKPAVRTGGVSHLGQQTASLNGVVNPHGAETSYAFEYGPTIASRIRTVGVSAGKGTKGVRVTVPVAGLAPATTYRYRIVATNAKGSRRGEFRSFKTRRQPLGVSLAGVPNPVRTAAGTTLTGALTGTGNGGRQIVLQSNPWPYTQGFVTASNVLVTNANGGFSFPVLSVPVNTQFRVLMPQKPGVVSPILVVGTKVRATTHVRVRRGSRSGVVRLSGSLTPAVDGTQVLIQKFVRGKWTNIGSTAARHASGGRSRYSKSVRQRHPGRYRVYHSAVEPHVPNVGATKRVRRVRS